MQLCKDLAFNPTKLVESLKLRTTEQQDAQEYAIAALTSRLGSDPNLQVL